MEENTTYHILHKLSRVIIIIPIAIVLVALLFKVQSGTLFSAKNITVSPSVSPMAVKVILATPQPEATPSIKLDLSGPWSCNLQNSTISSTLQIENKQVMAQFIQKGTTENFLIKGDCAYEWKNSTNGDKMCGVTSYIEMYEALSGMGMADMSTLLSLIPMGSTPSSVQSAYIQKLINSCKKQDVKTTAFALPKNIIFKDSKMLPLNTTTLPMGK